MIESKQQALEQAGWTVGSVEEFICESKGMHRPSHIAFASIPSIAANKITIGRKFKRKNENEIYTRIKFENKLTVIYRCVENIVAESEWGNVYFIPCNELVNEVLG